LSYCYYYSLDIIYSIIYIIIIKKKLYIIVTVTKKVTIAKTPIFIVL